MFKIRKAEERGHNKNDWLDTFHTFSFDTYYDNQHMNFRSLRVINEDRIAPGQGFGTHPHKDMEIITYVLKGALEHKDSMGNGSVIRSGDVQKMSAGRGILHSEFNHSKDKQVHLYQIWIRPDEKGLEPYYEQKHFSEDDKLNKFCLIASNNGDNGTIKVAQDMKLYASILNEGEELTMNIDKSRHIWIQILSGMVNIGEHSLKKGDGVALSDESDFTLIATKPAEFLVFDLS